MSIFYTNGQYSSRQRKRGRGGSVTYEYNPGQARAQAENQPYVPRMTLAEINEALWPD